jgi:hypothetical protein
LYIPERVLLKSRLQEALSYKTQTRIALGIAGETGSLNRVKLPLSDYAKKPIRIS